MSSIPVHIQQPINCNIKPLGHITLNAGLLLWARISADGHNCAPVLISKKSAYYKEIKQISLSRPIARIPNLQKWQTFKCCTFSRVVGQIILEKVFEHPLMFRIDKNTYLAYSKDPTNNTPIYIRLRGTSSKLAKAVTSGFRNSIIGSSQNLPVNYIVVEIDTQNNGEIACYIQDPVALVPDDFPSREEMEKYYAERLKAEANARGGKIVDIDNREFVVVHYTDYSWGLPLDYAEGALSDLSGLPRGDIEDYNSTYLGSNDIWVGCNNDDGDFPMDED